MAADPAGRFRETHFRQPIRDLRLEIAGTRLEPIIDRFRVELRAVGITRLTPHFYLSTDWGVPFETIAIGIPFYLAHPELETLHAEHVGHIEGFNTADILRYLRHEMGHVVNYAYKLYDDENWIGAFGSNTQPYLEDYRPQPFSTRFVQHLPGWYAQKHPDEDWSETFAVWMTPDRNWRAEYAGWPRALAKLEYCDATMGELNARDPLVTSIERDDDVGDLPYSVQEFYRDASHDEPELPPGLDGALRSVFEDRGQPELVDPSVPRLPAAELIHRLERPLMADVFRWTGHFPERTRWLLRKLADRAEALNQVYPATEETEVTLALTILVTALATTYVLRGSYLN